jgi:hypothetical protein
MYHRQDNRLEPLDGSSQVRLLIALLLIHPHLGGRLVGRRLPQTCPHSSPDYNADGQENDPKSLQDDSREVAQGEGSLIFGDPGEGRRRLGAICWCYRLIHGLTPLAIVQTCVLAVFRQSVSLAAAQAFCDTGGGNYDKMCWMAHVPDLDGPYYLSR